MIKVNNLSFSYSNNLVLENVNFQIKDNNCMAIMGNSGCGKSTLLDCISGFLKPDQGEIYLNDRVLSSSSHHMPAHEREIGVIFQQAHLFPHLNIAQNICFSLNHVDLEVVHYWIDFLEIKEDFQKFPDQLSGGQQQRVAIARTLAANPKFILMDEPYSSLDQKLKNKLRLKIKKYLKEKSIPSLLVTHQLEEAKEASDHLFLLKDQNLHDLGKTMDFNLDNLNQELKIFFT